MPKNFSLIILGSMVAGVLAGYLCYANMTPAEAKGVADGLKIVTDIFLRLIKVIIAPLVFSTLVAGIAHMGSAGAIGRIGARTLGWFIAASAISLTLGLIMVTWLKPGAGLGLPLPPEDAEKIVSAGAISLKDFITHLVPRSFFEAMADTEILQIVVFSVMVGVAMVMMEDRARPLIQIAELIAEVMLKITTFVMLVAPFAVFAAVAATVAKHGLEILWTYGKFILGFYAALAILWGLLLAAGGLVIGRRVLQLTGMLREPILLAFSTSSSEAAYPRTMEILRQFGVPRRITGFVLPLGYSFNLDGSMMYCTFATLFIAQVYGIELSLTQQVTMLLLLMVTSKGMAGVPRASLVVIAATLAYFGIPESGLLLIFAVDQFLDMGRSATNVVGNAVAAAVQAKWEGELKDGEADVHPAPAPPPVASA